MKNLLIASFVSLCLVCLYGCDALGNGCEDCGNTEASESCCPAEKENSKSDGEIKDSSDCSDCCP